jgi:DNA repair protein RadC
MSEGQPDSTLRLKDQPESERPRERLAALGPAALSNAELIAILLRTGLRGMNVVDVAKQLLLRFPTLNELAKASVEDIRKTRGIGHDKAVTLSAAFALAQRMAAERTLESPLLETPAQAAALFREELRLREVETFMVALLNVRRRLIRVKEISQGSLDTLLVHAREVFREAIAANAAALVLAHNHPSGDPSPSEADIRVTRDLIRAGQLLKIEVLDHLILGRATEQRPEDWVSLRQLGYFHT